MVESSFEDSGPLHWHCTRFAESFFRFCTQKEMDELNTIDGQRILKKKCLIVNGMSQATYGFDRAGLRNLATLDKIVKIEGTSFYSSRFMVSSLSPIRSVHY